MTNLNFRFILGIDGIKFLLLPFVLVSSLLYFLSDFYIKYLSPLSVLIVFFISYLITLLFYKRFLKETIKEFNKEYLRYNDSDYKHLYGKYDDTSLIFHCTSIFFNGFNDKFIGKYSSYGKCKEHFVLNIVVIFLFPYSIIFVGHFAEDGIITQWLGISIGILLISTSLIPLFWMNKVLFIQFIKNNLKEEEFELFKNVNIFKTLRNNNKIFYNQLKVIIGLIILDLFLILLRYLLIKVSR